MCSRPPSDRERGARHRADRAGRGPRGENRRTFPLRRHGNVRPPFAPRRANRRSTTRRRLQHPRTPHVGVRRKASPCPQSNQSRSPSPPRKNNHRQELTALFAPRRSRRLPPGRAGPLRARPIRPTRPRRLPANADGGHVVARTAVVRPNRAIPPAPASRSAVMPTASLSSRNFPTRRTRGRSAPKATTPTSSPMCWSTPPSSRSATSQTTPFRKLRRERIGPEATQPPLAAVPVADGDPVPLPKSRTPPRTTANRPPARPGPVATRSAMGAAVGADDAVVEEASTRNASPRRHAMRRGTRTAVRSAGT